MALGGLRLSGMITPPPHLYITCTSHNIHVSFTATAKVALMLWISEITDFQGIWLIPLVSQHCLPSPFSAVHSNSILEVIPSGDLQACPDLQLCSAWWHRRRKVTLCCPLLSRHWGDRERNSHRMALQLPLWLVSPVQDHESYPGLRENYST